MSEQVVLDSTDAKVHTGLVVDKVSAHYQKSSFFYDFSIARGECLGVVGPSGGGKSTLLSLIAGFMAIDDGDVRMNGNSIRSLNAVNRPVTEVFQSNNLFAHLTLRHNVALGLDPALKLTDTQWKQVDDALAKVGLGGLGDRLPATLSGGQQSRASLARALLRDRPILLLDEPLAALGPAQRKEMLGMIEDLTNTRHLCTLLVSHQPDELLQICTRIAFVAEGKIAWIGPTEELNSSQAPAVVRDYLGEH